MADPVYRVNTAQPIVYLTFDDGPFVTHDLSRGYKSTTLALLQLLDVFRGPAPAGVGDPALSATFFLSGWGFVRVDYKDVVENPGGQAPTQRRQAAEDILARGHDIANHSMNHPVFGKKAPDRPSAVTIEEMRSEISLAQGAFTRLRAAGKPGKFQPYFRSPGDPSYWVGRRPAQRLWGATAPLPTLKPRFRAIVAAAELENLRYISYNIWTKDDQIAPLITPTWVYWHGIDATHWNTLPAGRANPDRDLLSFEDLARHDPFTRTGAIILMHSGRLSTVTALGPFDTLPGVIKYIYEQGFQIRKLPPPHLL